MVARLRALLGDDLVGVYAGGSFALGGYEPERSDLDVAAVCRRTLADGAKEAIASALQHESLPCPARGLELVVYAESRIGEATADAGYELNLNTGRAMPFQLSLAPGGAAEHWYAIDRVIICEHGVVLFGPPATAIFAPVSRETLLELLTESVRWHEEHEDARPDDAVLNACRAWRYATEGVWSAKPVAGEWAQGRLGDGDLLSVALAARRGSGEQPDRDRVGLFLRGVRQLLDEERRLSRS